MKTIKLILNTLAIGVVTFSCNCNKEKCEKDETIKNTVNEEMEVISGNFTVDVEKSVLNWKGVMLGIKEHTGTVNLQNGNIVIENNKVTSGKFIIDLKTINPTDKNYTKKSTPEKLVEHLSSSDFFETDKYPTVSFKISNHNVENNEISGILTIKGISKEVTVKNLQIYSNNIKGVIVFDRQDFNVNFQTGIKDAVISDDITINFDLIISLLN